MTPAEFRAARLSLGLTQEALAEWLGYKGTPQTKCTTISRFERGTRPIPPLVEFGLTIAVYNNSTPARPPPRRK